MDDEIQMRGIQSEAEGPERAADGEADAEAPWQEVAVPPFKPVVSKSQSRALFAKAGRGELSMEDAEGKTRAADWSSLPERKSKRKGSPRGKRPPFRMKR